METLQPTKQNDMVANSNNYRVSKNKHTTDEDKYNQIHSKIKIHNEHLKNINEIEKYKKLNMTEHKTDMNNTKIEKYKILNMTEHKTDMNITKTDKYKKKLNSTSTAENYWKTEQHFYDGTLNRIQLNFGESNNNQRQIQQRSKKPQNLPQKR